MQAFIEILSCRFHFTAVEPIHLAAGKSGNIFRGAIGSQLMNSPANGRIFAPSSTEGPSGFADPPRPFVLRATHLDGRTLQSGDSFHVDLNLFDLREEVLMDLHDALSAVARAGFGPGRGRARFDGCESQRLKLTLCPASDPVERVLIRFVTPTELKTGGGVARSLDFEVLFARARDRVSSLCSLYGAGPIKVDFKGMSQRAAAVRTARCDIQRVDVQRSSSRTGQVHSLGGFTGEAEYEGDLREFVPFLEAAHWTGVGRHTVWGNGWITVVRPA